MALLNISPSSGKWHHGHLVPSLHHQVEDTAGEPRVNRQVVRKTREVIDLVTSDEEFSVDVEIGEVAGSQPCDVREVVDFHPTSSPSPGQVYSSDQMFSFLKRLWKDTKIKDAFLS